MEKSPIYGTSLHYIADEGSRYLKWQSRFGSINGIIESRKFGQLDLLNSTVLDFGAGTGFLLDALSAKRKIAVEINPHASETMSGRSIECYSSLDAVESGLVDVAISNHCLEHVPYPIQALREIYRVLKPGGILILCVPIDDWRVQKHYKLNDINHHLNTWTPLLLGHSLSEAGFKVVIEDIKIINRAWPPYYWKLYPYKRTFNVLCFIMSMLTRRRQIMARVSKI
jgi:SAM-dependent methyltransferase